MCLLLALLVAIQAVAAAVLPLPFPKGDFKGGESTKRELRPRGQIRVDVPLPWTGAENSSSQDTECPPGTSYGKDASCTPCPKGSYAEVASPTSCTSCPPGMTTAHVGSTTIIDCSPMADTYYHLHPNLRLPQRNVPSSSEVTVRYDRCLDVYSEGPDDGQADFNSKGARKASGEAPSPGDGAEEGVEVGIFPCIGVLQQKFTFEPMRKGVWTISPQSYPSGCLQANSTGAAQYACAQMPNQEWSLLPVGTESYQIMNTGTGLCMEMELDSAHAAGEVLTMKPCDPTITEQQWTFELTGREDD